MSGDIFLQRNEDDLVKMQEAPYDAEYILQKLLAKFPDLLAGDQLGGREARRWLLIDRESPVPDAQDGAGRWSLDHLFLDQDAVPTLVEVKRSSDTRIRREVVGQLIDYAANAVVYWPIEVLRASFDARLEREGLDADEELSIVLGQDGNQEAYWEQAAANLRGGRIRLVFVADKIPRELGRVVEFLNEQMDAEVIAIEVKQYVGPDGLRTLVPRVIGQTAAAETRKGSGEKRRPNLSYEELDALAEDAGVGELYNHAVTALEGVLSKGTTRSTITFNGPFGGSKRVVIMSLLPSESSASDGLRYQLYQKRFAELANLSAPDVENLLPPQHEPWEYFSSADPDWQGFQGCFTGPEQIDRLAGALSQATASS